MPNHRYTNICPDVVVDDRIGKAGEWVRSTLLVRRCSDFRKLFEERNHSPELAQEARGDATSGLAPVEAECVGEVLLRAAMKGVAHSNSARRRAKTSGPETAALAPDSISASRRTANSSHARWTGSLSYFSQMNTLATSFAGSQSLSHASTFC